MSDGPFRNTALSTRWKEYGQRLVNDAMTSEERALQACHSMIEDVDFSIFKPLYEKLALYAERSQMDLDAVGAIETIFSQHPNASLTHVLQRHLLANLREEIPLANALKHALDSTTKMWISTTRNRLDEECIRARSCGDMNNADYEKGIERNRLSFYSINPGQLCDALISGNKRAFHVPGQKKSGIDEGPEE